jgi:hypothetical protein
MSFLAPVTPEVLDSLGAQDAAALRVWSANHSNIFDLPTRKIAGFRVPWFHSPRTCPFLSYIPAYLTIRGDREKWAQWLLGFFAAKHVEAAGDCNCGKENP